MAAPSSTLPVPVDARRLLRRLAREERAWGRELADLEDRVRRFEDVARPAYDQWLRLELGPVFAELAERVDERRARALVAERVSELVDREGLHPREALHLVTVASPTDGCRAHDGASREEIEARRRAKLERKRAARKQARRGRRAVEAGAGSEAGPEAGAGLRARVTELYRGLARRLHPDSTLVVASLAPARLRTVWMEVQAAYGAGSLERLLAISAWLETAAEAEQGEPPDQAGGERSWSPLLSLAERHERLRAVQRSHRALERRLVRLAREPGWGFVGASPRARRQWKHEAAQRLEAELAEVRADLRDLDDFFAAIGTPRAPRSGRRR